MKWHNPANERSKRHHFTYLAEAKRLGQTSIDSAAAALHQFENRTRFRDFKRFHIQQAITFKRMIATRAPAYRKAA